MFASDDTIVAIATPPGRGGLGVIRVSGPAASTVVTALLASTTRLEPRRATFARLRAQANQGAVSDQVVVTLFPAPHSYTGEQVVEISAHGSPVILEGILRAAIGQGARLAEPGEFTLRAFLHGKLDLVQAEAVADLIDAVTPRQARAAFDQLEGTLTRQMQAIEASLFDVMARLEASLDFPDEGFHFIEPDQAALEIDALCRTLHALLQRSAEGRLIRDGAQVAIIGTPNVGKSSLFNALLNAARAIVTPIAGTTRDLLTERCTVHGISLSLVDTAGIRVTEDVIEQEGVARARGAAAVADVTMVVLDQSRPLGDEDRALLEATSARPRLIVINKIDLAPAWSPDTMSGTPCSPLSLRTGSGLEQLTVALVERLGVSVEHRDRPLVTNVRHELLMLEAVAALERANVALHEQTVSEEFVLADLQDAANFLQEVTGRRASEELLAHIFSRFCVGK